MATIVNVVSRVRRNWSPAVLFIFAVSPAFAAVQPAAPSWKPEKAIELIAQNAPGGGGDRILRIMAKVLQEQRLTDVPIIVVNKPGGGGSVAYTYLTQRSGSGHHIVSTGKMILTNNLMGVGPSFTEFTPVAKLFNEYIAITVRPESALKSGRDLIERLKKDPAALSIGIAGSPGNANHQGVAAALKAAGVDVKKLRTVVFQSGGAAMTAMLGDHVDVVPLSVSFAASLLRGGQVRLLAIAAPRRLPEALAEVPTWREQGYDAVVSNWRAMIGPRGLTEAQTAYWEQTLQRMSESSEWKKELEVNFWASDFMRSAEARQYMERDNVQVRAFLTDLGLVK